MEFLKSAQIPQLDVCDRDTILNYFENTWAIEEILWKSLASEDAFYLKPDPLRNPLIFYLGHSAVFYINKLSHVGLLNQRINAAYEILFEVGVDPSTSTELDAAIQEIHWPQVKEIWQYRDRAKTEVAAVIQHTDLKGPIEPDHPLWALMMAMEHHRIHFETTSMLIRQLPLAEVVRPQHWQYAPSQGASPGNDLIQVQGGWVELGKPDDEQTYGWDNEYGQRQVRVLPFLASPYLITNGEFLAFVNEGGYHNRAVWDAESWIWKTKYQIEHPKFWSPSYGHYAYRALFDQMDLPLDWPVEVNHYEAMAYCRWKGEGIRLMSEAEWMLASQDRTTDVDYNLDLKFGSPSPVGSSTAQSASDLYDLRGNVWEWLNDQFYPLPGFQPHPLYEDYSVPFFDSQHKMMRGGAWASTGAYASPFCRNWFRCHFYQHVGFRVAQDC